MEEQIRKDIRDNIYTKLQTNYNISNLKELNGYQNFVCQGTIDGESYILRISHDSHRSYPELASEIKFINLLAENNLSVARPVEISTDKFLEQIESKKELYFLSIFEKAKGVDWHKKEHSEQNFFNAGKALGKIHRSSQNTEIKFKREPWYKNQYLEIAKDVIPEAEIIDRLDKFMEELARLPKSQKSYGLTHGDYFYGNLIYNGDEITVIDFDEAEYNWFIYDIAVYLFYYLLGGKPKNMDIDYNKELFRNFIAGYNQVNQIDPDWLEKLPLFFRLREFVLLSSIYRSYYPDLGQWQQDYIEVTEHRIKNNIPFVDIDYKKIYQNIINGGD